MPDIAGLVRDHGYWVLALVVMLENTGLPVPGETALLAAGYLTSADGGRYLHLWAVVPVAFCAAIVGDNLGFWLGRKVARPRLAAGRRFLFLTPERMRVAERYFETYGVLTVFFSRFVTGLRVVAGPAAGASGMRWGRFLVSNAAGPSRSRWSGTTPGTRGGRCTTGSGGRRGSFWQWARPRSSFGGSCCTGAGASSRNRTREHRTAEGRETDTEDIWARRKLWLVWPARRSCRSRWG